MGKLTQIARDLGSVSNVAPFASALPLDAYLTTVAGDGEDAPDADACAGTRGHPVQGGAPGGPGAAVGRG